MSRGFKLFIFVSLFLLALWGVYPSIEFYFLTDPVVQDIVRNKHDENWIEKQTNFTAEQKRLYIRKLEKAYKAHKGAITAGLDITGGVHVVIQADFEKMARQSGKQIDEITDKQKEDAIDRVMTKIETRINQFGVSETKIRKIDEKRIEVEIPGTKTTDELQEVIETVGKLEFRLVNEEFHETNQFETETTEIGHVRVINTNIVPADSQLLYLQQKNRLEEYVDVEPLVLYSTNRENSYLDGSRIKEAKSTIGNQGGYVVSFQLDMKGAGQFAKITSENIKKRLAIVLDDHIMSAPSINSTISASGQITGNFTADEAKNLALILRSGSLPVPIEIISEEIVGPSLGRENLKKSLTALAVGLLLVIFFIFLRYRLSGIVASLALVLNAVGIIALLAPLNYTITLPGIAGLILTMGMAIDANVIIFERIKEELFREKHLIIDAIPVGYDKTFWAILDANFTTLIAAAILARFGTGVIQGFAVVLFFGIVVSLFTSLGFTRLIFEYMIASRVIKKYSPLII